MQKIQFITSDNIKLAADSAGSGPPVVLLHGGGQTRGTWRRTVTLLADRGYNAIAVDSRGHGESDWSNSGYTLDTFVDDLKCIVGSLGQRPALVGASLGGLTSMLAIGESESPIASALVLVDIATRIDPSGGQAIHAFMTANPEGFVSVEAAAEVVAQYLPHRRRPKDISGLRRNLRQGTDGRFYWHWDPALFSHGAAPDPTIMIQRLEAATTRIPVPTLLLRGSRSEIVTPAAVEHFKMLLPTAECVEIPGASHLVAGDADTEFSTAVVDFLMRCYPAS